MSRRPRFLPQRFPPVPRSIAAWTGRLDRGAPWGARLVLASGLLFGAVSLLRLVLDRSHMFGVNAHVYYLAGVAVRTGGDLYAVAPPGFSHLPYVYPPIVALAFVPYGLLGSWEVAFAVQTALSIAAGLLAARLLVRLAEGSDRTLSRLDRALVAAFVVGSIHATASMFYGNVNHLLLLAIVAGVVWVERSPALGGVLFALPAVVKVFPAAFGIWLLRLREWRAIGAAVATGLVAVGASFAIFGVDAHRTYLEEALLPRRRSAEFAGGLDPDAGYMTLRRPVSVLLPDADPALFALVAGLLLTPVVVYLLTADVGQRTGALVALHGVVAGTLLFLPSYQIYFLYLLVTLVPLLYRLEPGLARTAFVAGGLVANAAITRSGVESFLGPPLEGPILAVLTPVLTFGSPRLYGTLLTLVGCVIYLRRQ